MENSLTNRQANALAEVAPNVTALDMRSDPQRFPRIHSYSREQAVFQMSRIVSQAFLYRGQSADPVNVKFIASSLVDELQADNDNLGTDNISFAELSRIIKKAVLTTDMFGISVASLYRVIIDWVKGEGHRLSLQVTEDRQRKERIEAEETVIAPMLKAYAGEMLNSKKR